MNWQQEDNRHYRGQIDRIYVSRTEYWEVHYFIDHYLQVRGWDVNEYNRRIVGRAMEQYPGRAPVTRVDLTAWLNANV